MVEYTLYQMAEILGVHYNTVRRYCNDLGIAGRMEKRDGGGRIKLFSKDDLQRLQEHIDSKVVARVETTSLALNELQKAVYTVYQESSLIQEEVKALHRTMVEREEQHQDEFRNLQQTMKQELSEVRKEGQAREQQHQAELRALQQEMEQEREAGARREAAAARREVEQREQLEAIQEALLPWWKKIFRREKNENE